MTIVNTMNLVEFLNPTVQLAVIRELFIL